LADNFGFLRIAIDFRSARRQRMGGEHEFSLLAAAPAAAESLANLDEVNWALIFVVPARVSNFLLAWVDQDQASGTEQWFHPAIIQAHVTIKMARGTIE
jgi:hypothetical protein